MKKLLLATLIFAFTLASEACWYSKSNYIDYIHSINDIVIATMTEPNGTATFSIQNNRVVDLPLTVSIKLVSNVVIDLNGDGGTSTAGELIKGKLQYRVLPGGNWITVSEYETASGTIAKDSKPATYFGKNNIWPKGLKAGDVIMVRFYVTDGMWQSGELNSMCSDKLTTVSTVYGNRTALPNTFSYMMDGTEVFEQNLGGSWYPHFVTTVVFSGVERPLR